MTDDSNAMPENVKGASDLYIFLMLYLHVFTVPIEGIVLSILPR